MMDEQEFRRRADAALAALKASLITAEESADMEVEEQAGDRKSTRLNSSHIQKSRMPSSA